MPNFKLVFREHFRDVFQSVDTQKSHRIIVADDLNSAKRIGEAMLGEEVNASEYLGKLLSVEKTDEPADICSWDENFTWNRVLENLGLKEDGVRYYMAAGDQPRRVGIKFLAKDNLSLKSE